MRIPSNVTGRSIGHAHFWERAAHHGVTRSAFLKRTAGAVGAVTGLSLLTPGIAQGAAADPKPIAPNPNLFGFRLWLPVSGNEPSTITDFNGFVGISEIAGTGEAGDGSPFAFDVDMRFMKGLYAGTDGRLRQGSFAFV